MSSTQELKYAQNTSHPLPSLFIITILIDTKQREKRLIIGHGKTALPSTSSSTIVSVPLTKSHFLDAYSKGKWNLSQVPCPTCFQDIDLMDPPDHFNESSRLKAVKQFMNHEQWTNRDAFNKLLAKAVKHLKVKGAAISLIDNKRQIVKYQVSLNISECPRRVSIDAHTILSFGNFVLLDATKDWRTSKNPFVTGPPHIKFYAGVPLMTTFGAIIGAFSIFDPFTRTEFDEKQLNLLKELADEVVTLLRTPLQESANEGGSNIPLIKMIGRPTSQRNQFTPSAVYEKDGSGSQYSQNFNFRYSKQDTTFVKQQDYMRNQKIIREISLFRDIKSAANHLCSVISNTIKFDLVCVVEIRASQHYQISPQYFPNENIIDAETFKYPNKLTRIAKEEVKSRPLGSFGFKESDINFNPSFYYASLSSEFGIFYESTTSSTVKFKSGISMPFYRIPSKMTRRRKIVRNEKLDNGAKTKPIEVYLRSGGYLIAAFNEAEKSFSEEDINFIYGSSSCLRRLFITN